MKCKLLIPLMLCAWGCEPEKAPEEPRPQIKVDLPPMIKLEGILPAASYPDQVMRVDGLIARRDQYFDKKIKVRGYLVEIYQADPMAEKFEPPHFWIATEPDAKDKRLMIVGYPRSLEKQMEIGSVYDFTGQFVTSSKGFIQSTGLLAFEAIDGLPEEPKGKGGKKR